MSKKSRRKSQARRHAPARTIYIPPANRRPFYGLANEIEFALMRDLLPAASLELTTTSAYDSVTIRFVTVAPGTVQGLVRDDGVIMVALQTRTRSQDASHDLGLITSELLHAAPGTVLNGVDVRRKAPNLQELFGSARGELVIHDDYGFWLSEKERTPEAEKAIERTRREMMPSAAIPGQRGAVWCRMNRDYLRWVRPEDEVAVGDGLARMKAAGTLDMDNAHFIGIFRLYGLMAPVWEFSQPVQPEDIAESVAALGDQLTDAIASDQPLDATQRQARAGVISREVTVR